jgi:hypothetical protein
VADIPAQLRLRACFMQARNPSHISHIAADLCDSDGCACERAALVAGGPRVQAGRAAFGQAAALAGGAALRVGRGDAGGGALSAAAECRRGARGAIHDGSVGWGIAGGEVWVGLGSAAAQHHRAPCAVRRAPCAVRSKPLAGSRAPEAVRRKPCAGSRAPEAARFRRLPKSPRQRLVKQPPGLCAPCGWAAALASQAGSQADRLPDCPSPTRRGPRAGPFITERASAGFGVHVTGDFRPPIPIPGCTDPFAGYQEASGMRKI